MSWEVAFRGVKNKCIPYAKFLLVLHVRHPLSTASPPLSHKLNGLLTERALAHSLDGFLITKRRIVRVKRFARPGLVS